MQTADVMFQKDMFSNVNLAQLKPFFNYPGSKQKLAPWIVSHFPIKFNKYYEPFAGSAAVFLQMGKTGLFNTNTQHSHSLLADSSPRIFSIYYAVKYHLESLLRELKSHQAQHSYNYCRKQIKLNRTQDLSDIPSVSLAARYIYLRSATLFSSCFSPRLTKNGVLRPYVPYIARIAASHDLLQNTQILLGSYSSIEPSEGDLIYCDPPYTNTTQGYSSSAWGQKDDIALRENIARWIKAGATVALSSNISTNISHLYAKDFITYNIDYFYRNGFKSYPGYKDGTAKKQSTELLFVSQR